MTKLREYKLLETYDGFKMHVIKDGFATELAAIEYAKQLQAREDREFKVQLVTTQTSITNIFTVPALQVRDLLARAEDRENADEIAYLDA